MKLNLLLDRRNMLLFGIAGFFIFLYFSLNASIVSICENSECFISGANSCKNVQFIESKNNSVFLFSSEDCVLTKMISNIPVEEPGSVRELLIGKSMTCIYEEGKFNERWINTLFDDIDRCSGELREILGLFTI